MFEQKIINKVDKRLSMKLDILYKFKFNGLLLFYGDTLKKIMIDENVANDYCFVLLTYEKENVKDFLKQFKLKYNYNETDGYMFKYNNNNVKIKIVNDLCYVGNYSTDFLFYDICRKQLIPIGIKRSILKREIIDYNEIEPCNRSSLDLSKKFINYFSKDNKRIRLKIKNGNKNIMNKLKQILRG